jgi:hypothetical protein
MRVAELAGKTFPRPPYKEPQSRSQLRAFYWVAGAAFLALCGLSRFAPALIDADAIAYTDLSDAIRGHHWPAIVNAYWHPLCPAALALSQIVLHRSLADELSAYYTANVAVLLLLALAVIVVSESLLKLRAVPSGIASATPPSTPFRCADSHAASPCYHRSHGLFAIP